VSEFDRYSKSYADVVADSISFAGQKHDFFTRAKARVLVDVARTCLGDPSRLRALDVGCGVGLTDELLAPQFGELSGVDLAAEAVAEAARRNPDVAYAAYAGDRLPHDDAAFDFTFAVCVAHHVPPAERPRFASELRRVTRPGGVVALAEHNPFNPLTRLAVARCEFDEDAVLLTRRTGMRLLRAAGLDGVASRYLLFFPWEHRALERAERALVRVPLGAQYVVAGRRPG
jgi:SAM-dependent methyltransferase